MKAKIELNPSPDTPEMFLWDYLEKNDGIYVWGVEKDHYLISTRGEVFYAYGQTFERANKGAWNNSKFLKLPTGTKIKIEFVAP